MKNVKLSTAQQKVMDLAHNEIMHARECAAVEEWYVKYKISYYCNRDPEEFKSNDLELWMDVIVNGYNNRRNGIVLTQCSSKTLAKLEKLGLIEIIYDSNGKNYGIDTVKVLDI